MAFSSGSVHVINVDSGAGSPVDISEYVSSTDFSTDRDTVRLTVAGGNAQSVIVKSPATKGTIEGYYDPIVVDVFQDFMEAASPATRTITYQPQGTGTGLDEYTGEAYLSNFKVETPSDDVATFSVDYEIDGAWTKTAQA